MLEVGEANTQPYQYRFKDEYSNDTMARYDFVADGDLEYDVYFQSKKDFDTLKKVGNEWWGGFEVQGFNDNETTNQNDVGKVMSTITKVILDFVKRYNPRQLIFEPTKVDDNDRRRFNVYMAYIKKNLPDGYEVSDDGNNIMVTKTPTSNDISEVTTEEIQNMSEVGDYQYRNTEKILEVGEGTHQPYQWRNTRTDSHNYDYEFRTEDGDDYEVVFMDMGNFWNTDFKTKEGKFEDVLNKGRFYEVMATVADIIKDFLIKESPELMRISPAKNSNVDQRRLNIYMQFITKQIPRGYEVSTSRGYIYVQKVDELDMVAEDLNEQQNGVYTIPDLAKAMKDNLKTQGHEEQSLDIMGKWLFNAFRNQGDQGVIDVFVNLTGVQIEAVSRGRYMFANLYNPEKVNEIIREEVQVVVDGVGDKYAEKKWGIPDTEQQFQDKGVPDSPGMGEKIIDVWGTDYRNNKTQYGYIYKNPTSLKGFDVDVRAIGMPNGDLYVAQHDGDFIHTDMELALEKKIGYLDNYLEFHRAGDSNSFGASDTLLYRIDNHDISTYEVLKALENKHPEFDFSTDYYQDLRENKLNIILREELAVIMEGVGDRYAAQQGVPDAGEEFQKHYQQHLKTRSTVPENGQLVGNMRGNDNINVNIYMNPTSLKNFEASVRAFSDNDNNLFVAQLDTSIIHNTMGKALQIGNVMDTNKYITWIRAGLSDKFILSYNFLDMYDEARHDENQEISPRVAVLNTLHPYSFHILSR